MYDEAQQFLATEIARLCNIPAYLLSAEANNSMTYANVLDERKQFFSFSVAPYVNAISHRLSMDDITARGNSVRFDVDSSFLKTEPMERLLVLEKMLSLGLITVEQAMEMEDLTPNGSEGISQCSRRCSFSSRTISWQSRNRIASRQIRSVKTSQTSEGVQRCQQGSHP